MKKCFSAAFLLLLASAWCYGQDSFAAGEDLFMQNRPREAAVFFENAISEDPTHVMSYLYLGISYEQLNRIDEAITVYQQVLGRAGDMTATVAKNMANAYFKKGSVADAEAMYTRAIDIDRTFASAWLGRANSRLQRRALWEAVADYEMYIQLEPRSSQRETIERLINYIRAEAAEAERMRIVAEEMARADAERRQRLLDEISASLQGAADGSQGLSAGAEDVIGYEGEFELE